LLADKEKFDEALEQYEEYLKEHTNNPLAYLNSGIIYSKKGDYTNAIKTLEAGRAVAPKNTDILKELAKSYHLAKQYDKAILTYDQILVSEPDNTEMVLNKGIAYHAQKKYTEAIDIYKSVLAKDSKNKPAKDYLLKAYSAQGDNFFTQGNYRKAINSYEAALAMDSENPLLYINIANAYDKLDSKTKSI
jgi:tetratricopeptide (TPR) repeat protein